MIITIMMTILLPPFPCASPEEKGSADNHDKDEDCDDSQHRSVLCIQCDPKRDDHDHDDDDDKDEGCDDYYHRSILCIANAL